MCVGGTLVQVRVGGDVCGRNTGAGEGGGRCVWVYEIGGSFLMIKLFYLRGGWLLEHSSGSTLYMYDGSLP